MSSPRTSTAFAQSPVEQDIASIGSGSFPVNDNSEDNLVVGNGAPPSQVPSRTTPNPTNSQVNRSMSDHPDVEGGLQSSARRYQAAGAELIHRHKRLLNFVFGTVMFGMTVAGLWLQIAEKH